MARHRHPRVKVTIRVRVPKHRGHQRRSRYISASTQGMTLAFTGPTSLNDAVNLTPSDPRCSGSPLTCTITVTLEAGSYTVTLDAYDQAPVSGAIPGNARLLSTAKNVAWTVVAGRENTLGVILDGVVSSLTISGMPRLGVGLALSAQSFTVSAFDADGNLIVGPYDSAVTLTDGDTSGATSIATSGSDHPASGQLLSSADTASLSYNGASLSSATVTAAATGATQGTSTLTAYPVVASLSISGMPSATANTAFGSAQTFTVTAKDSHGSVISGTYYNSISLSDSDTSGATTVATSGSDNPPSNELASSGDTATIDYTGLAISPATITASASGVTDATAPFAPAILALSEIASDSLNLAYVGWDLYAASGTGSTQTIQFRQAGWTNSPYNKSIVATPQNGCSSIGTISQTNSISFLATVAGAPSAGTCNVTISGGAGETLTATLAYSRYEYTGGSQTWTAPAHVTSITVDAAGAQGGTGYQANSFNGYSIGGQGGQIAATISIGAGATLNLYVGGQGGNGNYQTAGAGGYNGGAAGNDNSSAPGDGSGGGGGASDVRSGGTTLGDRVLVAGGGGGGAVCGASYDRTDTAGGAGGGTTGATGNTDSGLCSGTNGAGGAGGTQSAGGTGGSGTNSGTSGSSGLGGQGGVAGANNNSGSGGGGGGGYYGGGGGGGGLMVGGGGGGGSSYIESSATNTTNTQGGQTGNGYIAIIF